MFNLGNRRNLRRILLATATGVALGAVAVGAPATAAPPLPAPVTPVPPGSTSNPYSPAYGHPYRQGVVPTLDALARMNAWSASHATAVPAEPVTNNLTYYGGGADGIGVAVGRPKVYLVFWGTQWGTQSTNSSGDMTFSNDIDGAAPKLQELFKGIGTNNELWSGTDTQYCDGVAVGTQICGSSGTHVPYPLGGAYAGVWYDNSAAEPTNATKLQIGQEAVRAASHFGNTNAAANRNAQYDILSAHNMHPDNFPVDGWCAWHNDAEGVGLSPAVGDVAFTNMPYVNDVVTDAYPNPGEACGKNWVNSGPTGVLDGFTMVNGHEYSETLTDQNIGSGWMHLRSDGSHEENMDMCNWIHPGLPGGAANLSTAHGSFAMQTTWSNDANGGAGQCVFTHSIVSGYACSYYVSGGNAYAYFYTGMTAQPASGYPTLEGKEAQCLLTRFNRYSPGRIDGQFGPNSQAAARAFQTDMVTFWNAGIRPPGLSAPSSPDGQVGPKTWPWLRWYQATESGPPCVPVAAGVATPNSPVC